MDFFIYLCFYFNTTNIFFFTEEYKSFRLQRIHVLFLAHDRRVPNTKCCGLCNQSPRIDALCIGMWHVRAEFSPVQTYYTRKSLFVVRHTHADKKPKQKPNQLKKYTQHQQIKTISSCHGFFSKKNNTTSVIIL